MQKRQMNADFTAKWLTEIVEKQTSQNTFKAALQSSYIRRSPKDVDEFVISLCETVQALRLGEYFLSKPPAVRRTARLTLPML